MLPPVLEVYVVWHPGDARGKDAAEQVIEHFHGTLFSGLIGGAVEVYTRTTGWRSPDDAPRPIPLPTSPPPREIEQAQLTAIVPVLGLELASAVQDAANPWHGYVSDLVASRNASPTRVGIFPLPLDAAAMQGTMLSQLLGTFQQIAAAHTNAESEVIASLRCRDLAQGIAQMCASSNKVLTVFISHTKRAGTGEGPDVAELIENVRQIVSQTRLREFFDAHDLQPGEDWAERLRDSAGTSAMLAVRTDLYTSREWCQREVLIAKRSGMPVVILDALGRGEERGSFLMDHVPRVPVRGEAGGWSSEQIRTGLNVLVDECLKRALWRRQQGLAGRYHDLSISWWAPNAPEPVTLIDWLQTERSAGRLDPTADLRILHPDPPLGPEERATLEQLAGFGGISGKLDVLTPRLLAARGG